MQADTRSPDKVWHIPLHLGPYSKRVSEWDIEAEMWAKGKRRKYDFEDPDNLVWVDIDTKYKDMPFSEWSGERPAQDDYMPEWAEDEATHYQMYETCTEGTPISPVFDTPEKLARWLADNEASAFGDMTASYESWLRVCRGGYAPSAVAAPGVGLVSGVEGLAQREDDDES
jgi:hypothetical protein